MIFFIVGCCLEMGQFGIVISLLSIVVGVCCLWVCVGVGVVVMQNIMLLVFGFQIFDLIEYDLFMFVVVFDCVLSVNGWSQYWQVMVIDGQGQIVCFIGKEVFGMYYVVQGEQCVVVGNLFVVLIVIDVMVWVFEQVFGLFVDCLLVVMYVVMVVGGEVGLVYLVVLKVVGDVIWLIVDLCVDWVDVDLIGQFDVLWCVYWLQMQDYQMCVLNLIVVLSYGVLGDE